MKADVSLFAHLYIVAQDRKTDLNTFFPVKYQPISLSDRGNLRFGKKSDLLKCLMQAQTVERPVSFKRDGDDLDLAAYVEELDKPLEN